MHLRARLRSRTCLTDAAGLADLSSDSVLFMNDIDPVLPRVVDFRPGRRGVLGIYRCLDATLKGRNGHGPGGTLAGDSGRCPAAAA